jgi:hypothetical protein
MATPGSFVVEEDVLAGWTFLTDCGGTSFAAKTVPEKVHNTNPAINKLTQRDFIRLPPENSSGHYLPGLIIQKFKKITIKKNGFLVMIPKENFPETSLVFPVSIYPLIWRIVRGILRENPGTGYGVCESPEN